MNPSPSELIGRAKERRSLDELLDAVRGGQPRVLVVRGDAGIGKSALLDRLIGAASGFTVVHVNGVESEMELSFAALHQLCASMLDRLDTLPAPQRDAASTAFGLAAGTSPPRLLIGLAVLNLLTATSEERPLLCVVDDADWLDRESAQALAFVSRRLLAEPIAMVFATRSSMVDLAGLPELVVERLRDADAQTLLSAVLHVPLDERVRDRIVAETHGNPLALVEWPRGLTPAELAGGFGMPTVMPMTGQIEMSFRRRVAELPPSTQQFLTVAAAEPTGDPVTVWRAARALGVAPEDASPAVEGGLLELGARVLFRHPLVRSAVYRSAADAERRRAHEALADATDAEADPDRRAWHRAQAASGADEGVAVELERSAARAQGRGGLAAAAAFLDRAVTLSADPGRWFERTLAAAEAKLAAGEIEGALRLLALADARPLDALGRARVTLLRGSMAFLSGNGGDAPRLLVEAASELESRDPELASEIYLQALAAVSAGGTFARGVDLPSVAKAARARPPSPPPRRASELVLDGLVLFDTEGPAASAATLADAVAAFRSPHLPVHEEGWRTLAVAAASVAWDHNAWDALAADDVRRARDTGALTTLAYALNGAATAHLFGGDLETAAALLAEAENVVDATGSQYVPYGAMQLEALRGREVEARTLIEAAVTTANASGQGIILPYARSAAATLFNGLARYDEALAAAREAMAYPRHWGSHLTLHELVEAAVRAGAPEHGAEAVAILSETATASGTDWGLGAWARARALLAERDEAEALYRESIERLGRAGLRAELARSHLLYGEWLRRTNRRADARAELRTAHDMLNAMGMAGFAERARRELLATGETVRKRTVGSFDELTAQEANIARLAADGRTNPEIGAQLFISPRTVEWHLRKVFTKLGVTSRRELRDALARQARLSSW